MNYKSLILAVSVLAAGSAGCGTADGIGPDEITRESAQLAVDAWTPVVGWSFSTPHPYPNRASIYKQLLSPSGATQLRLIAHGTFDLENGYDYLEVYKRVGTTDTLIRRYTGTTGPALTETLSGGTYWLRLATDFSITKYGFNLTAQWSN